MSNEDQASEGFSLPEHSERTKVGLAGAIKQGHNPSKEPLGYKNAFLVKWEKIFR